MTRKDYQLIADALRHARPLAPPSTSILRAAHYTLDSAARHLAEALALDNPRFDRERFLKAAGVTE